MGQLRLKDAHESSGRFKGDLHVPKGSSEARRVRGEGTVWGAGESGFKGVFNSLPVDSGVPAALSVEE